MLKVARDGGVATLTLDYPERRNALAVEMRRALVAAFERIEADASVRVVVLNGAGGHFCAGGDISGMDAASLEEGRARFRVTHALVRAMVGARVPIVAAVEGSCVGAGLSLALACDTVVAGAGARFGAPFERVGLVGDLGLLHTLPARIGQGRARQMLLYGETIGVEEAERIGLVDRVAEAGGAFEAAMGRARVFEGAARLPAALTKQFFAAGLNAVLDWEREVQSALFLTPDHAEGKAAFLEKRAPRFS